MKPITRGTSEVFLHELHHEADRRRERDADRPAAGSCSGICCRRVQRRARQRPPIAGAGMASIEPRQISAKKALEFSVKAIAAATSGDRFQPRHAQAEIPDEELDQQCVP